MKTPTSTSMATPSTSTSAGATSSDQRVTNGHDPNTNCSSSTPVTSSSSSSSAVERRGRPRGRPKAILGPPPLPPPRCGSSSSAVERRGRPRGRPKTTLGPPPLPPPRCGTAARQANPRLKVSLKEGALRREDVMCPICWSMLYEPVTFPCTHSLCYTCYKKHVQETSLSCPCCRMRLSVWSRNAFKENNFVDKDLWDRIQKEFPRVVEARRCGEDTQNLNPEDLLSVLDESGLGKFIKRKPVPVPAPKPIEEDLLDELLPNDAVFARDGVTSFAQGELKKELEAMNRKHEEDIENKRRQDDVLSQALIRELQEEPESPEERLRRESIDQDFLLAKTIQEEEEAKAAAAAAAKSQFCGDKSVILCSPTGFSTGSKRQYPPSAAAGSARALKKAKSDSSQTSIIQFLSPSPSTSSYSAQRQKRVIDTIIVSPASPSMKDTNTSVVICDDDDEDTNNRGDARSDGTSAFSPLKPGSPTKLVPTKSVYESDNVVADYNRIIQMKAQSSNHFHPSASGTHSNASTPNSIDGETNSFFRPIQIHPKTPPRKLSNGVSLPDPTALKITPVRTYLCEAPSSIQEQNEVIGQDESPGCQDGDIEIAAVPCSDPDQGLEREMSFTGAQQSEVTDGERNRKEYEVSPSRCPANTSICSTAIYCSAQSLLLSPSCSAISGTTTVRTVYSTADLHADLNQNLDPGASQGLIEMESSQIQIQDLTDSESEPDPVGVTAADEDDVADLMIEEKVDQPLSQNSQIYIKSSQQELFQEFMERKRQEREDLLFAKKLQKELNQPVPPRDPSSLSLRSRSWLKKPRLLGEDEETSGDEQGSPRRNETGVSSSTRVSKRQSLRQSDTSSALLDSSFVSSTTSGTTAARKK